MTKRCAYDDVNQVKNTGTLSSSQENGQLIFTFFDFSFWHSEIYVNKDKKMTVYAEAVIFPKKASEMKIRNAKLMFLLLNVHISDKAGS